MKFQKAEVELILFDNSDVIVTSPGDLKCDWPFNLRAYCERQGDSTKPNECEYLGAVCPGLARNPTVCNASGNWYFVNAPRPDKPVDK